MGYKQLKLDTWAYRGTHASYDKQLQVLAAGVLPYEKWTSATGVGDYNILRNYLAYTFEKLWDEREEVQGSEKSQLIYEDTKQACFNTGLLDKHWQPVFYYCIPNNRPDLQKWKFSGFFNDYTLGKCSTMLSQAIMELKRPNYFDDPAKLVFDVKLDIIPQWKHILEDHENFQRIPEQIRLMGEDHCRKLLEGAIKETTKRIEANYKTAVPQWYKGKIQLLAPLYLTNPNVPDLALVLSLSEDGSCYYGHTCLTIDMAYNNARLIAKPESFWLQP